MIFFTKHALERLRQRNISQSEITQIDETNFIKNENKDDFGNLILQIKEENYLLRVFYKIDNNKIIIITAYKTTKFEKYNGSTTS